MDLKLLRFLAFCSNTAYDTKYHTVKRGLKKLGYTLKFYENDGTECFMAIPKSGDYVVVSFRGTEVVSNFSIIDIFHNLILLPTFIPYVGKLHTGYYHCAENILELLRDDINNLNVKDIIFTGHSMGAAVAHNCSILLNDERITTVGFGLPKYINPIKNFTMNNTYYVLLFEDMMTRTFWIGYQHIGKLIFIDNLRNITDKIKFNGTFFEKLKAYLAMFLQCPYDNHDIQKYEIVIKRMLNATKRK